MCRRRCVVLRGEPLAQLVVERAEQVRAGEVDAEHRCPRLDGLGVAQDGEVRDPAAQHDVRGLEDAVVVPLGQDDVPPVGHGEVEQVVLEHQRRDHVAARDLEPVQQGVTVDVLVEQRERGRDLARRVLVQASAKRGERGRGLLGPEVGLDDRHRGPQSLDEAADLRGQRDAAVEDDPRHLREVRRHLGGEDAEDHLRAVARGHDHGTVEQPVQHVGQRHRSDRRRRWPPAPAAAPRR